MGSIRVAIDINASTQRVWEVVEPIERHIDWMADAVAIRFKTDQTRGTGTEFYCDTKVGPIKLVDEMKITSWVPEKAMGVTHTGPQQSFDAIDPVGRELVGLDVDAPVAVAVGEHGDRRLQHRDRVAQPQICDLPTVSPHPGTARQCGCPGGGGAAG